MSTRERYNPWLRLVRLPNLLTVPGDPVAGFLLAASSGVLPARAAVSLAVSAGAALCLYAFGLILNDLLDLATDQRERPERPLPAGEISVLQARVAAVAMAVSGLNLALFAGRSALYVAAALSACIVLYNGGLKRVPVVGLWTMGLCRGLSLLLGAVAVRPALLSSVSAADAPVLVAAVGLTLYVAGFSAVAKREADAEKSAGKVKWLPFLSLLIFLPVLIGLISAQRKLDPFMPTVYAFLMAITLLRAWLLGGILYRLQPVPVTVGGHIRNLLMLQGCLCAAAGPHGLLPAVLFTLLSLVFQRLSAHFYSS